MRAGTGAEGSAGDENDSAKRAAKQPVGSVNELVRSDSQPVRLRRPRPRAASAHHFFDNATTTVVLSVASVLPVLEVATKSAWVFVFAPTPSAEIVKPSGSS